MERKLRTFVVKLPICFCLCLMLICVSCDDDAINIRYIVPDGYRGILILKGNDRNGVDVGRTNNTVVLSFPDDGVLRVKGKLPVLKWHQLKAFYRNGTPIPVMTVRHSVPSDSIALRPLGVTNDEMESWDELGTESDLVQGHAAMVNKALEKPDSRPNR